MNYSGNLIHKLKLFHHSGKDGQFCFCARKMAITMSVIQCRIHKQKQIFAECFCLHTELFTNRSIRELQYTCTSFNTHLYEVDTPGFIYSDLLLFPH